MITKIKQSSAALKAEFRKQASTAIIAAFGLIIATAWKDVIANGIAALLGPEVATASPGLASLISAIILTIVATIGILLISQWYQKSQPQTVVAVTK